MVAAARGLQFSRRAFVQGVGLAGAGLLAGCGQWPGQAAAPNTMYRVGLLSPSGSEVMSLPPGGVGGPFDAFRQGLQDYGYVEGENLILEYRGTNRGEQALRELATELVQIPVHVLVTNPGASLPAKAATDRIPLVFLGGPDPVNLGLVPSLARPGGNVTGITAAVRGGQMIGKWLELLQQVAPGLSRVAVLEDVTLSRAEQAQTARATSADALGLQLYQMDVRSPDQLESAFEQAVAAQVAGVIYLETPLLGRNTQRVVDLAAKHRLPSIAVGRGYAELGGLMAYGPSILAINRRVGYYVDRILKGTPPADIPVEQPTTFDFVINLKTAQALGLTIPQHVLLQATEIIQ